MASNAQPSATSLVSEIEGTPAVSEVPPMNLQVFRASDEGKRLLTWLQEEFARCRDMQIQKRNSWYTNLAMLFGEQNFSFSHNPSSKALQITPAAPGKKSNKRVVNRIRSFARTEHSKFISADPTVTSVPASGDDAAQRSAYAAEQVWESYQSSKQLRRHYSRAMWWRVACGTGFVKTWWDSGTLASDGTQGDVKYASITPFHLFVPILREKELEDQPYVIEAQVRPLEWAENFFAEQLVGEKLTPSNSAQLGLFDDAYLQQLRDTPGKLDQVLILEHWIKPGATKLLPNGGLVITVEDKIVHYQDSWPYADREFPYTKFEHIATETFYGDSPITDIVSLQQEYNDLRSAVALAARRMGTPNMIVQEGSLDPNKVTNEPGQLIMYRMGFQAPQYIQPPGIPPYISEAMDRVLSDIEDLTGQHEVSKGTAPTGITAGTALAFLKESDDNFLTPQHHDTEEGFEKIARKTLMMFNQYVDVKRRIRVVGADGAHDTELLSGADIADGLDVRVEDGSSVGVSMAAKRAQVLDMVDRGLLDPPTALKMLEVGGVQKALDIMSVAEKQAQRENIRMKMLGERDIKDHETEFLQNVQSRIQQMQEQAMSSGDPMALQAVPEWDEQAEEMARQSVPPVVVVNDFDVHEAHIEVHNRFRMSQEYESLPDPVKQQFAKHVASHQQYLQQLTQEKAMMESPEADEMSDQGAPQSGQEPGPMPTDQAPEPPGVSM